MGESRGVPNLWGLEIRVSCGEQFSFDFNCFNFTFAVYHLVLILFTFSKEQWFSVCFFTESGLSNSGWPGNAVVWGKGIRKDPKWFCCSSLPLCECSRALRTALLPPHVLDEIYDSCCGHGCLNLWNVLLKAAGAIVHIKLIIPIVVFLNPFFIFSLLLTWSLYDFALWHPVDSLRSFTPSPRALFNIMISQTVIVFELSDDDVFDWSLIIVILKSK